MFSTAQEQYLKSLIPTMVDSGYSHYIAYTYTNTNNSSWGYTATPDLYVVFSKQPITANDGYSYTVPADSVRYVIRTGNYSSSNTANNSERVRTESFSGHLSVDVYEHIYTNAEFSGVALQPDFGYESGVYSNYVSLALSIALVTLLLFNLLRSIHIPKLHVLR